MAEQNIGIKVNELEEGQVAGATIGDVTYAILKHQEKVYVLDGKCTHEGGPLGEGYIDNSELICPWHSGAYAVDTGKANENTPWVTDIKSYKVRIDDATGDIYVDV